MDYFYLKIGRGNTLVNECLLGKKYLACPNAPIFFDDLTKADYDAGKGTSQPREFVMRGKASLRDKTLMVVIAQGEVWVLKPADEVQFLPCELNEEGKPHTPKVMPVEIVAHKQCKDVPPVLAGIAANKYYWSGTFRKIRDWGNRKAIDSVVQRVGKGEHWNLEVNKPMQLLECLGSTEIETLVAKIFEASGCFVPAYRGGTMKDIDLFADNRTTKQISLGNLIIPPGESISIQVKRREKGMTCPEAVDCLIGLDVAGPKTFDAEWLLEQVRANSAVQLWLRQSLDWLPETFFIKFDL